MIRLLATFLVTSVTVTAQSSYSEAMYRRALSDRSTSPLYVLITLRDVSGSERLVCVPANFLEGAIHREYHLEYDRVGEQRMQQIAEKQPGRTFTFLVREARANVEPRYSPTILAEVESALHSESATELLRQMKQQPQPSRSASCPALELEFKRSKDAGFGAYRDAVAHVLLEHGILAGIRDMSGDLYLLETGPNQSTDPTLASGTPGAGHQSRHP